MPARRRTRRTLLLLLATIAVTPVARGQDVPPALPYASTDLQSAADERMVALMDAIWDWRIESNPGFATYVGEPGYNDRWPDLSPEHLDRIRAEQAGFVAALEQVDRDALSPQRRFDFDLVKRELEVQAALASFPQELLPLSQMSGVHHDVVEYLTIMPTASQRDFEDRIARLRAAPRLVNQTIELLARGVAEGLTQPQVILRDVPDQIRNLLAEDPAASPFMTSFANMPGTISPSSADSIREVALATVRDEVYPAFDVLRAYLEETYIPESRVTVGLSDLPRGDAWYRTYISFYTTVEVTPEEVHALGLAEVARIRAEMDAIIDEVDFAGDFRAFTTFLRTDPQFYFDDPSDLIRAYRDISKRADPELVKLFGRLPRTPYGVEAVPTYAEKSQTTAYYQPGSLRGGRPGVFYANTYDLESRPKWEMEALTLHEAVPGHHLQLALADELEGVHDLRKYMHYTAFIEGWGLYAESLGPEMGFYQDPYSRFGQLTYEIWRAIRLVVDTGMHALGWTRDEAISYFRENSAKTEHDVVVEIDRYIAWPGQALAYKMGELKIKELRAVAEEVLGERFDIRAFHDRVLESGSVPLDVLDGYIRAWISAQQPQG